MYRTPIMSKSKLKVNDGYEAESIEARMRRITATNEPIAEADGARIIHTLREEGVNPAYNIRTDRFDLAVELKDTEAKYRTAQREQRIGERTYDTMNDDQKTEFHKKFPNSKIKPIDKGEGKA